MAFFLPAIDEAGRRRQTRVVCVNPLDPAVRISAIGCMMKGII